MEHMQLLMSLCHFCEIHGPSVVFNTRKVHGSKLCDHQDIRNRLVRAHLATEAAEQCDPSELELDMFLFEEDNGKVKGVNCEGCSLHSNTNKCDLISFNEQQNICLISEDFPNGCALVSNSFDTSDIRAICLRSLSCELYPKNRGMLYFGTENNQHIFSFLFSLQDSKARGFVRKYSIFLMCNENKYVLGNWNMLVKNITMIISLLQRKAKAVYKSELTPEACLNKRTIILDKVASAGKNLNYFEEIFHRDPSDTSKNKIKARSLVEITGDNNIFYTLHLQFADILSQLIKREKDTTITNNQDGFFNLNEVGLISNFFCNDYASLRQLYSIAGADDFRLIASNVVLGNRVMVFDSNLKGRTKLVVAMMAKLLPQEHIQIQSQYSRSESECVSPSDSNLLGVCANFEVDDMRKLIQDFYLCVEICDKGNSTGHDDVVGDNIKCCLTARNTLLKIHCCDEISTVAVPNYIKKIDDLLRNVSISDSTISRLIDAMKWEWLSKCKMLKSFMRGATQLSVQDMSTLRKALDITDDDIQMIHFWSKAFLQPTANTPAK